MALARADEPMLLAANGRASQPPAATTVLQLTIAQGLRVDGREQS
jgi:hypothetical protein